MEWTYLDDAGGHNRRLEESSRRSSSSSLVEQQNVINLLRRNETNYTHFKNCNAPCLFLLNFFSQHGSFLLLPVSLHWLVASRGYFWWWFSTFQTTVPILRWIPGGSENLLRHHNFYYHPLKFYSFIFAHHVWHIRRKHGTEAPLWRNIFSDKGNNNKNNSTEDKLEGGGGLHSFISEPCKRNVNCKIIPDKTSSLCAELLLTQHGIFGSRPGWWSEVAAILRRKYDDELLKSCLPSSVIRLILQ